jgi:hypothetical protein
MKFSVSLSLKQPLTLTQIQPPDWSAINQIIAQNTVQENIAKSTEQATWFTGYWTRGGVIVAACALIAAGISAYYNWQALKISQKGLETSQKALETWRGQVLGEHEFGRLLDAIQVLHDIKISIDTMRPPSVVVGNQDTKDRSKDFREYLMKLREKFQSATVGLDEIWGKDFKIPRDELIKLIAAIIVASIHVFEEEGDRISGQYALMGQLKCEKPMLYGDKITVEMVDKGTKYIEETISKVQLFLIDKVKTYSGINK